jgi:hypothetical protein
MKALLGTDQSDITEFEKYATLLNSNLEILSSSHLVKFIPVYDYMSDLLICRQWLSEIMSVHCFTQFVRERLI